MRPARTEHRTPCISGARPPEPPPRRGDLSGLLGQIPRVAARSDVERGDQRFKLLADPHRGQPRRGSHGAMRQPGHAAQRPARESWQGGWWNGCGPPGCHPPSGAPTTQRMAPPPRAGPVELKNRGGTVQVATGVGAGDRHSSWASANAVSASRDQRRPYRCRAPRADAAAVMGCGQCSEASEDHLKLDRFSSDGCYDYEGQLCLRTG